MVNFCGNEVCTKRLIASSPGYHVGLCAKCYKAGYFEVYTVKSKVYTCNNFEKFEISIPIYSTVRLEDMAPIDERICDYSYITEEDKLIECTNVNYQDVFDSDDEVNIEDEEESDGDWNDVDNYDCRDFNNDKIEENVNDKCKITSLDEFKEVVLYLLQSGMSKDMMIDAILRTDVQQNNTNKDVFVTVARGPKSKPMFDVTIKQMDKINKTSYAADIRYTRHGQLMITNKHGDVFKVQDFDLRLYNPVKYNQLYPVIKADEGSYQLLPHNEYKSIMAKNIDTYTDTYGNLPTTSNMFVSKIVVDNKVKLKNDYDRLIKVYYDIETFNKLDQTVVPEVDDNNTIIGCLCAVVIRDVKIDVYVWYLDAHSLDIDALKSMISKYVTDYSLHIEQVYNDELIALSFLTMLKSLDSISIVMGFNSNMGMQHDNKHKICYGYDLPIIINKARSDIKITNSHVKMFNRTYYMSTTLDCLQKCYFMDMQYPLSCSLTPNKKVTFENFKLDSYLTAYGLDKKQKDFDYVEIQRKLSKIGSDVTSIINYCIYDCYGLHKLEEVSQGLMKLIAVGNRLEVGLYSALYRTQATSITQYLMRQFTEKGYAYMYEPKLTEKPKYEGAFTYSNDKYEGQVQTGCILDADFTSLYPSCIISGNLSPDTICNDANVDRELVNVYTVDDVHHKDEVVVFYKPIDGNLGLIPSILKSLLDERAKVKDEMATLSAKGDWVEVKKKDLIQYTIKIIANSYYGLLGSKTFPMMDVRVAMTTTYLGRKAIKVAKDVTENELHGEILVIDTDSVMAILQSIDDYKTLNKRIKEHLNDDRFELAKEAVFTHYLSCKAKKCYIGITKAEPEKKKSAELIIKGLSWSMISNNAKAWIKDLFKEVLLSGDVHNNVKAFYRKHLNVLTSLAHGEYDPKWRNIMADYCTIIKMCGKNDTSANLRERYNRLAVDVDRLECCEITKHKKVADNVRWIKDTSLERSDINTTKMLNKLMSGVFKLTVKLKDINVAETSDYVSYREEIYNNGSVIQQRGDQMIMSVEDFVSYIGYSKRDKAIHEVFVKERKYKLFLDLDHCSYENMCTIKSVYEDVLSEYPIQWAITFNGLSGYHLISNIVMSLNDMKSIALIVRDMLFKKADKDMWKIIDHGIYKNKGSMRTINCPKVVKSNKGNTLDLNNIHIPLDSCNDLPIARFVISNTTDDCITFIGSFISSERIIPNIATERIGVFTERDISLVLYALTTKSINIDTYTITNGYMNLILTHDDKFICPIHERRHDREHAYVVKRHDGYCVYKCRRGRDPEFKGCNEWIIGKPDGGGCSKKQNPRIRIHELIDKLKEYKRTDMSMSLINSEGDLTLDHCNGFNCRLNFIKSGLGTGKSKLLSEYLKSFAGSVLVLSFRRSFTERMKHLYNCVSYLESDKGRIPFGPDTRLIIQIESLHRVMFGCEPDLVVIDEVMSVFLQVNSIHASSREASIYQNMCNILRVSKKVIAMDGLLAKGVIDTIIDVSKGDGELINYIENEYVRPQPTLHVYEVSKANKAIHIFGGLLYNVGAKIGIFSASCRIAEALYNSFKQHGHRVLAIYGRDSSVMNYKGEDKLMAFVKQAIFKDPESILVDYDVFIYTSTLTAGISIEQTPVDCMIGLSIPGASNPIDVIQAMSRIRQQKSRALIYVPGKSGNMRKGQPIGTKPNRVYTSLLKNNIGMLSAKSLYCCINALDNQLRYDRDETTFQLLIKDLGTNVNYVHYNDDLPECAMLSINDKIKSIIERDRSISIKCFNIYNKIDSSKDEILKIPDDPNEVPVVVNEIDKNDTMDGEKESILEIPEVEKEKIKKVPVNMDKCGVDISLITKNTLIKAINEEPDYFIYSHIIYKIRCYNPECEFTSIPDWYKYGSVDDIMYRFKHAKSYKNTLSMIKRYDCSSVEEYIKRYDDGELLALREANKQVRLLTILDYNGFKIGKHVSPNIDIYNHELTPVLSAILRHMKPGVKVLIADMKNIIEQEPALKVLGNVKAINAKINQFSYDLVRSGSNAYRGLVLHKITNTYIQESNNLVNKAITQEIAPENGSAEIPTN